LNDYARTCRARVFEPRLSEIQDLLVPPREDRRYCT